MLFVENLYNSSVVLGIWMNDFPENGCVLTQILQFVISESKGLANCV
ncbi:hypothetical protein B481_1458 [Planococcus halocryophilus Or1]|nr:hypothetical protein B481_1458 [Planococcus halocryophilus Or1]